MTNSTQIATLARMIPAIAALAKGRKNEPAFISPHQIEAALRIHRLFEKAQLRQNVTMHYGPRIAGGQCGAGDGVSDMAIDARARLENLLAPLPPDCRRVLSDICGHEMGIQEVEARHGWPRRSGKIVLRLALELIAGRMGLSPVAQGRETGGTRFWAQPDAMPNEIG